MDLNQILHKYFIPRLSELRFEGRRIRVNVAIQGQSFAEDPSDEGTLLESSNTETF